MDVRIICVKVFRFAYAADLNSRYEPKNVKGITPVYSKKSPGTLDELGIMD
jgi:hypothetical protein